MTVEFWTDGSGIWDPKARQPTGYAFVALREGIIVEVAGWSPAGTNNTAELSAAIMALESLNPAYSGPVKINTDSEYVLNQALGRYRTNTNIELVQKLQSLQRTRNAEWSHVRGHTGVWGNERADVLAGHARRTGTGHSSCFTHVRIYHQSDPSFVLLDKFEKPASRVWTGTEWLDLRLLV